MCATACGTAPLRRAAWHAVKDGHPRVTRGRRGSRADCRNRDALVAIRQGIAALPAGRVQAAPFDVHSFDFRSGTPAHNAPPVSEQPRASGSVGYDIMESECRSAAENYALQSSCSPDHSAIFAVSIKRCCACRVSRSSEFFERVKGAAGGQGQWPLDPVTALNCRPPRPLRLAAKRQKSWPLRGGRDTERTHQAKKFRDPRAPGLWPPEAYFATWYQRSRWASRRRRSAFSLMKPAASFWS
jgi:hypothetical protein